MRFLWDRIVYAPYFLPFLAINNNFSAAEPEYRDYQSPKQFRALVDGFTFSGCASYSTLHYFSSAGSRHR
jgi:hypothetical protein